LQNHTEEIKLFLHHTFIDILLISETHFTTKKYFGGTVILIKDTIEHNELLKYEEDSIQATSIKVKGFPCEITITAVYCPT